MFKISMDSAFRSSSTFAKMFKNAGINVVVENGFLVFPDTNISKYENLKEISVFDIDEEKEDFTFDEIDFSEYVHCASFDYKEVSYNAPDVLKQLQIVLSEHDLTLIDVETHGDSYLYFLSKVVSDDALDHIKSALKNTGNIDKLNKIIKYKPKKIEGKMDFCDIKNKIIRELREDTANIYLLKELLEDVAPESLYEIIEPDDGTIPYIKEIKIEEE